MEYIVQNLKVLWRSEQLLRKKEFNLAARKMQFNTLAGLLALFGFVMLSMAFFFVIQPFWGNALAALTVGGIDMLLALILVLYARALTLAGEIEVVREMRNTSLGNIEKEISRAETELIQLKRDVQKIVRHPMDTLLPEVVGPLVNAVIRGLGKEKQK